MSVTHEPGDAIATNGGVQQHTVDLQPATGLHLDAQATPLSRVSVAAVVLALIVAYGGQAVLLTTTAISPSEGLLQALAGGMLIAAALLFGAVAQHTVHVLPRLEFPDGRVSPPTLAWGNHWTVGWLATAIVMAVAAASMFARAGESAAVVASWLISIVALLIAQLWGMRLRRPQIAPTERVYLAALAVLLVVTLVTRVYKLTTLPYNVDGDFAAVGLVARALATGEQRYIFAYGWSDVPMLGYLPAWLTMRLFGVGLAGLNASGVVEGMVIIAGVYLLGRDLFHPRVGLIAAALLTASYTHLAASRQASYIDPVVFLVYAVYFLLIGLREGRGWAIVASGLLTGLGIQMYYSGRIVVFIIGFIFLFLMVMRRGWGRAHWWGVLLWVLSTLIMLGPMLVEFVRHTDQFLSRTRAVFILSPENITHQNSVYHTNTLSQLLLQQARHTALMFHYYVDTSTQFSFQRPFLDSFSAPLFTLGLGYALFCWRHLAYALMLAWIGLGVLLGCFLTINPPFWPRLLVLLPPTALLAAAALNLIYEPARHRLGRSEGLAAPVALGLVLVTVGVLNWNTYVEMKRSYATPRTAIARYLADQPLSTRAYLVSEEYRHEDREFAFIAPGRLIGDLTPEQADGDIAPAPTPTLLILTREQGALLEWLRQRFPAGSAEMHVGNSPHEVAFYAFRLP